MTTFPTAKDAWNSIAGPGNYWNCLSLDEQEEFERFAKALRTPAASVPDEDLVKRVEAAIDGAAGTLCDDTSCWREHALAAIAEVHADLAKEPVPEASGISP